MKVIEHFVAQTGGGKWHPWIAGAGEPPLQVADEAEAEQVIGELRGANPGKMFRAVDAPE